MTNNDEDYSAKFIYKPPYLKDIKSLESIEIMASNPIGKEIKCVDCEATSLAFILESINLDNPNLDLVAAMKKIKDAVLFVLWNTDWPVGE